MLEKSKIWATICEMLKKENNDLTPQILYNIHYMILHKYSLTLSDGHLHRSLINRTSGQIYIHIRRFYFPISDYDRVIENEDGYLYIQKVLEQKDKTKQYLQIKIHKDFYKRFCY